MNRPTAPQPVADEFGTSRTPVHEAVQRLADEGLIEVIPQPIAANDLHGVHSTDEQFHAALAGMSGCESYADRIKLPG